MKIWIIMVMVSLWSLKSVANECRVYTEEQLEVINTAYSYGFPHNYGYTLAAISIKESFVGDMIIRYNANDPSTGVTHIQFDTLKHLSGLNHWRALGVAEKMIKDDILSFKYSLLKLESIKGSFWYKWKRYNGSGKAAEKYANDIQGIIANLKRCGIVGG